MAGVQLSVFTPSHLAVNCPKYESSPPFHLLSAVGTYAVACSTRAYPIFRPPVFPLSFLITTSALAWQFIYSIFYGPFTITLRPVFCKAGKVWEESLLVQVRKSRMKDAQEEKLWIASKRRKDFQPASSILLYRHQLRWGCWWEWTSTFGLMLSLQARKARRLSIWCWKRRRSSRLTLKLRLTCFLQNIKNV